MTSTPDDAQSTASVPPPPAQGPEVLSGSAPAYGAIYAVKPPTNGLSIASLIAGIIAFLSGWTGLFGLVVAAAAIVCGHLAISQISQLARAGQPRSGKGLAITGLVLGYIAAATAAVVLIIAVFAIAASGTS
tara:strand:+ start:49 stop:444 length:396 start_codon:yes stop_codon:yes gene_type:complete